MPTKKPIAAEQLPSSDYVDKVVGSLEKHPFGAVMLLMLIAAVCALVYVAKH